MPFKLKKKPKYPRRLWALAGYPNDGKSTFATQMAAPLLPIDADHRFDQVMHLVQGDVYEFGPPADHVMVSRIVTRLQQEMPDEGEIGSIVVDSLTEIIAPLVAKAVADNAAGLNKNKAAAFIDKALAMRQLQSAVTRWGTDVLWIYHLQDGRDAKAQAVVTTSIPQLELARLTRSLNAKMRIVRDGRKRGIFVEWSRGRDGMTLWDESGCWHEMPEKLESAMYDGLSPEQIEAKSLPASFASMAEALRWAVGLGAYPSEADARQGYEQLKDEHAPKTAADMWDLWIPAVVERISPEPDIAPTAEY
ncbi:MAG: hypothetical protein L0322_19110 [Chloroflexi bacterium]|nr:hypothetical protein [Chloroflexota bacterium]MCI0574855.1 hypothetical protein [Chloroflexota bacterium]MCI0645926.1 hypothetical protein [Chloroflexota bacterium]